MYEINDEDTFFLDHEVNSDTDSELSYNYLCYSLDDSCSDLSSIDDWGSATTFANFVVKN